MSTDSGRLAAALADRYRIERELGRGGMATVYLAEDLKHDRRVALKVLKPELAAVLGAERFVVEIKTTAALQHPHILPLFDSGAADGFLYYVMPFIDGETLRGKLDRETQLGIEESVRIATSVADALDYAHRRGVVHRDIKPENILLHDGRPVVADFGIALALSAAAGGRMTETGMSLGTPHYMSPEQATAEKEVTGRSDIYSLGSVLYEMLTGDPPHTGAAAQQIIMKIVTEDPAPVTKLRKAVPANVAAAVAKSLEKLPADRFETAGAFARALGDPHFVMTAGTMNAARAGSGGRHSWRSWLRDPHSWAAIGAAVLLGATLALRSGDADRRREPAVIRATITGPLDSSLVSMATGDNRNAFPEPTAAPDGRHVAFGVLELTGRVLYVRAIDAADVTKTPGSRPFFSSDGTVLGFMRKSEVWSMSLVERVPTRIGAIPEVEWDLFAAAWHPDGRILICGIRGLWSIPARGGEAALLVPADSTTGEHFADVGVLADGRIMLNVVTREGRHIAVLDPDGSGRTRIAPGAESGWMIDDILVFRQAGQLRATRFDVRGLEPVGEPVALPEIPARRFSRSLAWVDPTTAAKEELVWVAPDGSVTPAGLPSGHYRWPRVSPDGRSVAVGVDGGADRSRILVFDVARRTSTLLQGYSEPAWSADGRRVAMSTGNRPLGGIILQMADGSRAADTLLSLTTGDAWPTSASADGTWLAYYGATLGGSDADEDDLFFINLGDREVRRVPMPRTQRAAQFSPDGRWIAYQSLESGRDDVHVRPWPAMDADYLVSTDGGTEPIWGPTGRELFYRRGDAVVGMTVADREGAFERSPPRVLFTGSFSYDQSGDLSYDVGPDGRFLMRRPVGDSRASIEVALNWITGVRARLERDQ
jgi:serine/threonine-protein kinase